MAVIDAQILNQEARIMSFSNVVLLPDQLALVQRVFTAIVGEPWFNRDSDNEKVLASVIVREFEHGTTDENDLMLFSKAVAQRRFSLMGADLDR
jgi:hypothetical protein